MAFLPEDADNVPRNGEDATKCCIGRTRSTRFCQEDNVANFRLFFPKVNSALLKVSLAFDPFFNLWRNKSLLLCLCITSLI